jgi:hypothetical protein
MFATSTVATNLVQNRPEEVKLAVESPSDIKLDEAIQTIEPIEVTQNTAIVYKSFTTKLKNLFGGLWRWFMSKL